MKKSILLLLFFSAFLSQAQIQYIKLPYTPEKKLSASSERLFSIRLSELPLDKEKIQNQLFTSLVLEGFSFAGEIGHPRLPAQIHSLCIAPHEEVELHILDSAYIDLDLKALGFPDALVPVQYPLRKDKSDPPALVKNKAAYRQKQFSPQPLANVESLGLSGDKKWVQINLLPFQYLPSRHVLRIYYRLEVAWNLRSSAPAQLPLEKTNKASVYLIASPQKYLQTLAPFIRWKSEKGFAVEVILSDQPPILGNREALYQQLSQRYHSTSQNKPEFLLLVGDTDDIPPYPTTFDDNHWLIGSYLERYVTDLYYAEYTGDLLPDLRYGRFSAQNESELSAQIDKSLRMEQLSAEHGAFLQNATLVSGWENRTELINLLNATLHYMSDNYFSEKAQLNTRLYWSPNSSSAAPNILQDIRSGCGFVNYTAHGDWNEWTSPKISTVQIAQMNNANNYPFMIGNCCLTNKFEKDACFGESLLRKKNGGAVAYIGASSYTYFDEDLQWAIGGTSPKSPAYTYATTGLGVYDRLFHKHGENYNDWVQTAGDFVFYGNLAVQTSQANNGADMKKYYWEIYHLLGDPSYIPAIGLPSPMRVGFPKHVDKNIPVITFSLPPHAYLGVSHNGILLFGGRSDAQGKLEYLPQNLTAGSSLKIVVSAQNHWVYIDSIAVESSHEAIVNISNLEIDRLSKNTLDFGKQQQLRVQLHNPSSSLARNIRVRIISNNPWTEVENIEIKTDSLLPQEKRWIEEGITIRTQAAVGDQQELDLQAHLSYNDSMDYHWGFRLLAQAPQLSARLRSESDKTADQAQVQLAIQNDGSIGIDSVQLRLQVLRPDVLSTLSSQISIGSREGKLISFPIRWESGTSLISSFPIAILIEKDGFRWADTLYWTHTYKWESFEDPTFSGLWHQPLAWQRVEGGSQQSGHALKSPSISHSDTTSVYTRYAAYSGGDSLLFDYRVSSESCGGNCGDGLLFRLHRKAAEGQPSELLREEFVSGVVGWTSVAYALPNPGLYAFEWTYVKDESASSGYDAAWIDNIRFPARSYSHPTAIVGRQAREGSEFWASFEGRELCVQLPSTEAQRGEITLVRSDGQIVYRTQLDIEAGKQSLRKSPRNLVPGLYICTWRVGDQQQSVKLTY